ncbi:MAG: S8 family serine peptidase, partial [Phaeodactylibacter sp.]|nr:S8 family serine peptidase [Phaeodactylibacter sp.]
MVCPKHLKFYCFFLLIATCTIANAQHVPGQLIVRLTKGQSKALAQLPERFTYSKALSRHARIHLVHYDTLTFDLSAALKTIRQYPNLEMAQPNHILNSRDTVPSDPLFPEQWQWQNLSDQNSLPDADVDAELAWSLPSNGSVTALGDTIVIALLDDGIQADHPDLAPNLWRNHQEIPNNQIDDDLNGYVDDYMGWNPGLGTDHIHQGHHGTPVAGMLGAAWKNGKGGTGIAPNTKIMVIAGTNQTEAEAIAAYAYVLQQRLLYNETQGEKGAFVVATNTSWGINGLSPYDAPIWCAFYDELGAAGVISCAATSNHQWNVDEAGDMPSSCSSPYLLTLTSTNRSDEITAGYGLISVDLAAPGHEVLTTHQGSTYGLSSGTSFATPIATGTIALLYASLCPDLANLAHTNPAAAALEAKALILHSSDPVQGMEGLTVTGGRLNVFEALQELELYCTACHALHNLSAIPLDTQSIVLSWEYADTIISSQLLWRISGTEAWDSIMMPAAPLLVEGLQACTDYEFQFLQECAEGLSNTSATIEASTTGCCQSPEHISTTVLSDTEVILHWDTPDYATHYSIQVSDETGWAFQTTHSSTPMHLSGLSPCTIYEVNITATCQNGSSETTTFRFVTEGCGGCTDFDFCTSYSGTSGTEWIDAITFGGHHHHSGLNEGNPLFSFQGFQAAKGHETLLVIKPGFQHIPFPEYLRVWIDLNQDGFFEPEAELLLDTLILPGQDSLSAALYIPENALSGSARMRISMKWAGFGSTPPLPCEAHIHFGEVEDYCVELITAPVPSSVKETSRGTELLNVWPNPFLDQLSLQSEITEGQA